MRALFEDPRPLMWLCLLTATVAGWALLAAGQDLIAAVCGPGAGDPPAVLAMWLAMALAMMLPTAAPMISTYLDIAEAAAAKGMQVVPAVVLVAGYLSVWAGFAAAAAGVQIALQPYAGAISEQWGGVLFIAAGAYQFAPVKHACLTKCRRPMPYFMAHWSERATQVFAIGLKQGALCLGCCWTLMALGLAAGAMNLAWMALLTVVMILEKTLPEPRPLVYGTGIGLIAAGTAMLARANSWLP